MLYNSNKQVLGANVVDTYARWLPQQAPASPVTIAVVGGSIALVAVILIVKARKKKGKRK